MLAPLGCFLLIMVITCTMILLICWVRDTYGRDVETGRFLPADWEFPIHAFARFSVRANARRSALRFPAPKLPEKGGIRGRHDLDAAYRAPTEWRLQGAVRQSRRFYRLPDFGGGRGCGPRP
jgi:hypothetical protein